MILNGECCTWVGCRDRQLPCIRPNKDQIKIMLNVIGVNRARNFRVELQVISKEPNEGGWSDAISDVIYEKDE